MRENEWEKCRMDLKGKREKKKVRQRDEERLDKINDHGKGEKHSYREEG